MLQAAPRGYPGAMPGKRAKHDENHKRLFAFPRMVEDLLRGFLNGEHLAMLDFSTSRKVPAQYVSDELLERHGDTVWQVRFRNGGRFLLVPIEFQSTVDSQMALRILTYTSLLYQELLRNDAPVLDARGRLPPVLPVVLYNGEAAWDAAEEMVDMIQSTNGELAPYQPSQRYFVLDERHVEGDDLPEGNLMTAVVRLEKLRSPEDLLAVVDDLREWLSGPHDDALRRAFTDWVPRLTKRLAPAEAEALSGVWTLEEMKMTLEERVAEWPRQWLEEGREQGIREGLLQGLERGRQEGLEHERFLLRRMAASRFGAGTAERLSVVLARITEPERLAEVGEWLVRCDSGAELLARVDQAPAEGNPEGA